MADDVVPDRLAAEREHLREVAQAAAPMKSDHAIRIPIADYLRIVNPRAVLDQLDEVERLRGMLRLKESAVESTYRAYVALQEKVEGSSLVTLAATQAADVAALAAENELLRSIMGKANPVTFNSLTIEEQQYLDGEHR